MIRRTSSAAVLIATLALSPLGAQVNKSPDLGTTVPGSWTTDRYAPCLFTLANGVNGRNNVAQIGLCNANSQANRPELYSAWFYNYQGMKIGVDPMGTTAAGTQDVSLDLFVNGSWSTEANGSVSASWWSRLNQVATDDEPDAGYTAFEFTNHDGAGRFRFWDENVGWVNLLAGVNYDDWNTLSVIYTGNVYSAYVNDVFQYSVTAEPGTDRITDVFFQGYNFGADISDFERPSPAADGYTANWSNTVTATPEPASLVLLATGLLVIGGVGVRRRRRTT
jgi:hypothetical protein